jgi:hypothetical protein
MASCRHSQIARHNSAHGSGSVWERNADVIGNFSYIASSKTSAAVGSWRISELPKIERTGRQEVPIAKSLPAQTIAIHSTTSDGSRVEGAAKCPDTYEHGRLSIEEEELLKRRLGFGRARLSFFLDGLSRCSRHDRLWGIS